MKTLTYISRHAPFGTSNAKACLDMVLASSVFEQTIHYVFIDDGIWQLVPGHQTDGIHTKNSMAALQALPLYGVDQVHVLDETLALRGLTAADLQIPVTVCTKADLQMIIRQSDVVTVL